MKFATVRELSSITSQLLKEVEKEKTIVITKFGKPRYLLVGINEDEIEDFILAKHYDLEGEFERAREELKKGKTKSRRALLATGAKRGR